MKWTLSMILLFVFLTAGKPFEHHSHKFSILYINSYNTGYSWTDEVTKGLMDHFNKRDSFLIYSEYMDTKRYLPQDVEKWFIPYLKNKYRQTKIDLIIASDNSALDLVLKYKDISLFRNIPVIFSGISNPGDYPINRFNLYGVVEIDMFVASFDVIKQLYPDFSKIYLFIDKTNTGKVYQSNAQKLLKNKPNYELEIVDSVYPDNIEAVMGKITDNAVIFYQGISVDGGGKPVDHMVMARKIFQSARVPVFSSYIIDIEGPTGGMFIGGVDHGKLCGEIAEKRLKKIPIGERLNIPPIQGIYDYSKLEKYNLNPDLVPVGTVLVNKPEPLFLKYQNYLIGNILVIGFLVFLILLLIRYNKLQIRSKQLLKKAMERAFESDRLKGAFLANVSHELRTPLNAICGFSELVKVELNDNTLSEYVDVIYKNSELLAQLVNDLLDISLIDANALVVNNIQVDLEELFNTLNTQTHSILRVKGKSHILVDMKTNPKFRFINTDDFRISQIMLNFINNAAKYTENGQITLGYDHIKNFREKLNIPDIQGNEYLVIYVKDTGVGIETEQTSLVFDRFRSVDSKFMSHHGGVGLGLNISKSLVELLGGIIFVKSKKGKGSMFGFLLPIK